MNTERILILDMRGNDPEKDLVGDMGGDGVDEDALEGALQRGLGGAFVGFGLRWRLSDSVRRTCSVRIGRALARTGKRERILSTSLVTDFV